MNQERTDTRESSNGGSPSQFTKSESKPSPFAIAAGSAPASASPFVERRPLDVSPSPTAVFSVAATPEPAAAAAPVVAPLPEAPTSEPSPFILDEIISSPTQAALRAIFGVEHTMNVDEILQRLRSLPGIRHLVLVAPSDVNVLDGLKKSLSTLGFGTSNIRIFGGNVPMEFVRHANILLAVQTVGGFGPGVKEAIKIATQEIHRLS